VTDGEQGRRGSSPAAATRPGGPAGTPARGPRPVQVSTFRTVIGVGPGTRPAARLSPIAQGPGRGAAPRSVPPDQPRPMHPPIARVMLPTRPSPAALQAQAAGARLVAATGQRGASPRLGGPGVSAGPGSPRTGFGMPSLRRNICPHFFMTGARGAMPIQAPHLLKALVRQETNLSRCQLRGGVHLEGGYVNDVCLSARFNQCVFYEDELTR
jgi:hypothetical protein